jgi:hypothetical protein
MGMKDAFQLQERLSISIVEYTHKMLTQAVASSRDNVQDTSDEEKNEGEQNESESDLDVVSDVSEAGDGMTDVEYSIPDIAAMAIKAFEFITDSSTESDIPNQ